MKAFHSYFTITCLIVTGLSVADEKKIFDTDQPISLRSNSISVNQKSGSVIYIGNVRLKQGDLFIKSSRARTKSAGNQPEHVWASGSPVRIERKRDGKVIILTAFKVHYDVQSGMIVLTDNVQVEMGKDKIGSKKILYNVKTNTILANSDDAPLIATFEPTHLKKTEESKK